MSKNVVQPYASELGEKCAVFGLYAANKQAARETFFGLYTLQHRGQESSGIAASDGKKIRIHKSTGLVAQVYSEQNLQELSGNLAIGHNRYATSGGSRPEHAQPVGSARDSVVLAHNGNLPTTNKLEAFLTAKGVAIDNSNDSELMQKVLQYFLEHGLSLENSLTKAFPLFTGAFSMLVLTKDKIAAIRDKYGIRPLSLGKTKEGYVFASETCAIDVIGGKVLRDVKPGEMVVISKKGMSSKQLAKSNQKLDIFEMVYFSRPDSILLGKKVYEIRKNLGRALAKEHPIDADIVIPVPDSAIPAANGYSEISGIPNEDALVKNRYIGRTFIMPDQRLRQLGVRLKLNPISELIKGKRIIVIDDSIVRGTTSKQLVSMLRKAGARSIHLMSSCPPVKFPDFYGIATPTQQELIAANMSISEIKSFVGADSLHYLSYKELIKSTGLPESVFCTSCFTGEYPIDIGEHTKSINFSVGQKSRYRKL